MTLHEIDDLIQLELERAVQIDPETGEVLSMDMSGVEALQMERDKKLRNVALAIKNTNSDIAQLKEEYKSIKSRIDTKQRKVDGMSQWLQTVLNGEKIDTPQVVVSYRKSTVVEIVESALPKKWWRKKVTTEPDKQAIKDALKQGTRIKGASLVDKSNMQIK